MASKHGAAVRGLDNVPHSSVRDQRFGRMFRNLPPAAFSEEALIGLAETMFHGEFARRIAAGVRITMKRTGRKKTIIGTVSFAGRAAAFFSAAIIRIWRFSLAMVLRLSPRGVPYRSA